MFFFTSNKVRHIKLIKFFLKKNIILLELIIDLLFKDLNIIVHVINSDKI